MSIIKKPYKLEVWQDIWNEGGYWDEKRVVVLGAHDMDFEGSAYNIEFTSNMSGEVKLRFSLNGIYYNRVTGAREDNYLMPYLFSEAKIKLLYEDKWYDFIIKNIEETHSKTLTMNYSCIYLPIHELAKTGWDLSFSLDSSDINTADYFMEKILDGTDWKYARAGLTADGFEDEEIDLVEYSEEPLFAYSIGVNTTIEEARVERNSSTGEFTCPYGISKNIVSGKTIYIPYSSFFSTDNKVQIFYKEEVEFECDTYYVVQDKYRYYINRNQIPNTLTTPTLFRGRTVKTTVEKRYIYYVNEQNHNQDINYICDIYSIGESSELGYGYKTTTNLPKNGFTPTTDTSPSIEKIYYLKHEINNVVVGYTRLIRLVGWLEGTTKNNYYEFSMPPLPDSDEITSETTIYFTVEENNGIITAINEVENISNWTPKINLEKNRALEIEESNRFNLTQEVAEIFEVWVRYIIEHDEDGRISLDEYNKPKKTVLLVNSYGEKNPVGFHYGLNSNSISRSIDSNSLITKLYVKDSEHDVLDRGTCAIQYAESNLAQEGFLLDFSYFVHMGLIDEETLKSDLYGMENYELGYLRKLGELNKSYDVYIEAIGYGAGGLGARLIEASTKMEAFNIAKNTGNGQLSSNDQASYNYWKEIYDNTLVKIEELNGKIIDIIDNKRNLHNTFNQKYARYLQEGSWSDDNYIDENAYYYDSQKVLTKGAKPNISYSIGVINLSEVISGFPDLIFDEFNYEVGDITFIEDVEYFGYTEEGTPYQEQIVISEIIYNLDNPSKTTITIQNYFTQFEDLFQRLSATVQSYEMNRNIYARAEGFSTGGIVEYMSLKDSFAKNKNLTFIDNDVVTIDNNGILVKNAADSDKILRLVSGGIVLSDDGGETYTTGIYAGEINTSLLGAGEINTEKLVIKGTGTVGSLIMTGSSFKMLNTSGVQFTQVSANIDTPDSNTIYYLNFNRQSSTSGFIVGGVYSISGFSNTKWKMPEFSSGDYLRFDERSYKLKLFDNNNNIVKLDIGFDNTLEGDTSKSFQIITTNNRYISIDTSKGWLEGTESDNYYILNGTPTASIEISPTTGLIMKQADTVVMNITPTSALIAGWSFNNTGLYTTNYTTTGAYLGTVGINATIGGVSRTNLLFKAGNKFGVTADGTLYCSGADISGSLKSGSIDGNINLGQSGKIIFGNSSFYIDRNGINLRNFSSLDSGETSSSTNDTTGTLYHIDITDSNKVNYGSIFGGIGSDQTNALWITSPSLMKMSATSNISVESSGNLLLLKVGQYQLRLVHNYGVSNISGVQFTVNNGSTWSDVGTGGGGTAVAVFG